MPSDVCTSQKALWFRATFSTTDEIRDASFAPYLLNGNMTTNGQGYIKAVHSSSSTYSRRHTAAPTLFLSL